MILPIHLLTESDKYEFGQEYVQLSQLSRHGIPIAEGLIVSFPEIETYLDQLKITNLAEFENKKINLTDQLIRNYPPLNTLNSSQQQIFLEYWPILVSRWVDELHSHFLRYGAFSKSDVHLKSQPIYFSKTILAAGVAKWDPILKEVRVSLRLGQLNTDQLGLIDEWVKLAKRKLALDFDYCFLVDQGGIKFIQLKQPSHQIERKVDLTSLKDSKSKLRLKRKLKLWTGFVGNFVVDEYADGYFLDSTGFSSHDQKQYMLLETMLIKTPNPILYQISPRFYKSDAAVIKFCKNQKKQDNLELIFDADCEQEELLDLKRGLAAEGVSRKGRLKFWLRMGLPSSLLKADRLIELGFDGVVIDTDILLVSLHGKILEGVISDQILKVLFKFLKPIIDEFKQKRVPVVMIGNLVENDGFLEQCIKWNIEGVIVKKESEQLDGKIGYQEQVLLYGLGQV